jgi:hypothetical protein
MDKATALLRRSGLPGRAGLDSGKDESETGASREDLSWTFNYESPRHERVVGLDCFDQVLFSSSLCCTPGFFRFSSLCFALRTFCLDFLQL